MTDANTSNDIWRERLTPEQYRILREAGTERPHTSEFNNVWDEGDYHCVACDAKLYESVNKFDAGCGWPSFDREVPGALTTHEDRSHGMVRTEMRCANCGGHLGHVFPDGPTETGTRHCVNGIALAFKPKQA